MASNRHLGRIIVLQTLYEYEFRHGAGDSNADVESILARNLARYKHMVDDQEFVKRLVRGVAADEAQLDAIIGRLAPEWPVDQIARVDRTVLRMALYELQHGNDVPARVVINEAVELAKSFGADNASRFVNGVLGTFYREHVGPSASEAEVPSPESKQPQK